MAEGDLPRPFGAVTATERELVARSRQGDAAAFEGLYRANVGRVFALCLRMCGDRGRAEELTQDAFVRAWRSLDGFRGDSAFSSWLYRVAINVVLSAKRSELRQPAGLLAVEELGEEDGAVMPSSPHLATDLERAIAALPAGARAVFVLHDVEGWRHHEIAAALKCAVGTCKAQLHRARKLLREVLR